MEEYLQLFVKETSFYNQIVLGSLLPQSLWNPLPHVLQTWLRNYIGGVLLYLLSGGLWALYIYYWKRNLYLPKGMPHVRTNVEEYGSSYSAGYQNKPSLDATLAKCKKKSMHGCIDSMIDSIPTNEAMLLQIKVAMKAMPWYSALPTVSEYMIESGWTRCFSSISEIGLPAYLAYLAIYLTIVEFGIYWMHRELHDIKPLYKYLHATHHIYNKQNTLSPFAGLAFHPIDGILQAVPHVIALFLVPTHFLTHVLLLFCECVWTTNIHDCIHGKVWPVMGAGYHTIHHTTYRHNYGHYTIWMDWMFGTLCDPEENPKKVS